MIRKPTGRAVRKASGARARMYTLRKFRMHTKQAFDDAAAGHEVVIKRNDRTYQLVALVDKPLSGHLFESHPGKKPLEKPLQVNEPELHRSHTYIDQDMLP